MPGDADGGAHAPDWNPLERPVGNWHVYRDLLTGIARLDYVAMANIIPWGSKNAAAFIRELGTADSGLLTRALEFVDDLNSEIVQALAPKLLVIPFSIGRSRDLNGVSRLGIMLNQAIDPRLHTVTLPGARFSFYTGTCHRGKATVRTLFLPHPASLRLSRDAKKRLIGGVSRVIGEL